VTEDPAWLDYRSRFADVYDESNYGAGLQGFTMRAGHELAEKPFGPDRHFGRVLEVGAGTGAHFPFVRHAFDEYRITDNDAKALEGAKARVEKLGRARGVSYEVQSAVKLDVPDRSFDRLVATHVLEHLYEPHKVLKEWARVVRPGGVITVLLPCDPGFAWRLGRMLGPRRNSEKLGVAYDYVMAREHVNPLNNLIAFLHHYFTAREEAWWPFRVPSMDANLFYVCHATVPDGGL
jgi:ubiquinone/menaquinone biosynthesis C-methylase UbiE